MRRAAFIAAGVAGGLLELARWAAVRELRRDLDERTVQFDARLHELEEPPRIEAAVFCAEPGCDLRDGHLGPHWHPTGRVS